MESVLQLHGTKTIIIVTHRVSTVEQADLIIRLDKGNVTQLGDVNSVIQSVKEGNR